LNCTEIVVCRVVVGGLVWFEKNSGCSIVRTQFFVFQRHARKNKRVSLGVTNIILYIWAAIDSPFSDTI
jgi:hypothetical protein